jgi:hypothetical protein
VQLIDYSRHAARTFFAFLVCLLVPTAIGYALKSESGGGTGLLVGFVIFAVYALWFKRRYRRDDGWMKTARRLGLKAIYSGSAPTIGLDGFQTLQNVVGDTTDEVQLIVGDRMEWYADYRTETPLGWVETNSPQTSDTYPEETFFALWIPGLALDAFALGRRKSLFSPERRTEPAGEVGETLRAWVAGHPGWRLEGYDDLIVGTRPNRVAPQADLDAYISGARSLGRSVLGVLRASGS